MLEENLIRWRKSWERQTTRRIQREVEKEIEKKVRAKVLREVKREEEVAGMQRLLLKQMKLRFGSVSSEVRREIREISSPAKLEELAGRLLTAGSLSDLGLGQ